MLKIRISDNCATRVDLKECSNSFIFPLLFHSLKLYVLLKVRVSGPREGDFERLAALKLFLGWGLTWEIT